MKNVSVNPTIGVKLRFGVGDGDGVERLERLRIDHDPLVIDYYMEVSDPFTQYLLS